MLNVSTLMGRLTGDPELRHTPNDIAVTSFTLAVDRSYARQDGEKVTDFIDIVAWRKTAEFVCKYFVKGQLVAVQGSIQTRMYQDKDDNRRKAFEIVADNVHFAEPKRSTENYNSINRESKSFKNVNVNAGENFVNNGFNESFESSSAGSFRDGNVNEKTEESELLVHSVIEEKNSYANGNFDDFQEIPIDDDLPF